MVSLDRDKLYGLCMILVIWMKWLGQVLLFIRAGPWTGIRKQHLPRRFTYQMYLNIKSFSYPIQSDLKLNILNFWLFLK